MHCGGVVLCAQFVLHVGTEGVQLGASATVLREDSK